MPNIPPSVSVIGSLQPRLTPRFARGLSRLQTSSDLDLGWYIRHTHLQAMVYILHNFVKVN